MTCCGIVVATSVSAFLHDYEVRGVMFLLVLHSGISGSHKIVTPPPPPLQWVLDWEYPL